MLGDVSALFAMHCVALAPGQRIAEATTFPNPLGGPPLSGTTEITLAPPLPGAGTLVITVHDTLDAAGLAGMVAALVPPGAAPELVQRIRELVVRTPIQLTTDSVFEMDAGEGFPRRVTTASTVSLAGRTRVETRVFTRAP